MGTPEPWDLVDPARTIAEMLRLCSPQPGDVLVGMVPAGREQHSPQELVDVSRVHRGDNPQRRTASELLHDHALAVAGERPWLGSGRGWRPPKFLFVTVVCREGWVVHTREDYFWLAAWRYSNHNSLAFDGDVYRVTEHGWTGAFDQRAGFEPSLRPRRLRSVVQALERT
jgi:hypothetical protein